METLKYGARLIAEWDGCYLDFTSPTLLQFWSFLDGIHKQRQITRLLPNKNDLFLIDVGACIGAWSISMALRHSGAHILAFEPYPISFQHYVRNLRGYDVDVHNLAVSDRVERITIQLPTEEEYAGQTRSAWWRVKGNIGSISAYGASGKEITECDCVRLDDVAERADAIKIDVEGMERHVLLGAERILRESRPILQVEIREHNQQRAGYSCEELIKLIEGFDYVVAGKDQVDMIFVPREKVTL